MALRVHHVFVLTTVGAPEAGELLAAGLIEGSPNIHPGQGTANRRFFFESGYLECFWVHDEQEARSPLAAPTRLWERWDGRGGTANPFGLCFSSTEGAGPNLPFPTWAYRPDYLSGDRSFLFADGMPLSEPEIFVLSWPQAQSPPQAEPTNHPLGLREMQSVSVGLPDPSSISSSLRASRDAGVVKVHRSATPELVIEFTSLTEVQLSIAALGLSIVGRKHHVRNG